MPKIPAMHRALDMPEIVSMICGFAASEFVKGRYRTYCHNLARTCRRFREPALDVLWETLGDMAILLKCFPNDVWIEERWNRESHWYCDTVLRLARCPTPQEWDRPLYYAARVKTLSASALAKVDVAVYAILAMSCPALPLFPNLQQLPLHDMNHGDGSVMPFRRYLISSSIKSLDMALTKWENPLQATSFITVVSATCKPTCLDLSRAEIPDDAVAYMMSEWSQLLKVQLGSVHATTMQRIAALPSLRILKLAGTDRGAGAIHGDLPDIEEGHDRFPALQRLVVRDVTIEAGSWLLALMDHSPVTKLQMHFSVTVSAEVWQQFIQRSCDAVDNETLERLVLFDDSSTRDSGITRDIITSTMVAPLSCFRGLTHLAIRPRRPVHLDGAMLLDMGKALANIRYLDMRGERHVWGRPSLNMHDLVVFALQCPALKTVGLSIDALDVPWPKPGCLPEDGCYSRSVTKIMVGDAIIEAKDRIVFASYLSFVFPNLYDIETWSVRFNDEYFNWKRVQELLPLCRTVRQQGYIHGLRQEGREGDGSASFGRLRDFSDGWAPEPEECPEDSDHQYTYDSA